MNKKEPTIKKGKLYAFGTTKTFNTEPMWRSFMLLEDLNWHSDLIHVLFANEHSCLERHTNVANLRFLSDQFESDYFLMHENFLKHIRNLCKKREP